MGGLAKLHGATNIVVAADVIMRSNNASAAITFHEAKTAGPGEIQSLQLSTVPNSLCPVAAVKQLISGYTAESISCLATPLEIHAPASQNPML
jgi:hypothetical protein